MSDRLKAQQRYKNLAAFGDEYPRETFAAIQALRPWEKQETTLVHAVALAIQHAYQLGLKGKELPTPHYENLDEDDVDTGSATRSPRTRPAARAGSDVPRSHVSDAPVRVARARPSAVPARTSPAVRMVRGRS